MKKGFIVSIVATLALSFTLSACSSKSEDPGVSKPADKKKFSMLVSSNAAWPYSKDWPVWKYIDADTNVSLEAQIPAGAWAEALNLTVASGSMPDLLYMDTITQANTYGQQGALANFLDYSKEMPNLKKWLDANLELKQRYLSADGKMFMLPNQGFGETNRRSWLYREDIFKKNDIKAPTTYDELYAALKKLKGIYPNSYPFSFRNGFDVLSNMAANFGTGNTVFYDDQKKNWRYGPIDDSFKSLLQYLNKFYKEGLMPPDWLSYNAKQWNDLIANNQTFVMTDYIVVDTYNIPIRKENPSFNMLFLPPPAGLPGGKQINPNMHVIDSGLTVASTSKQIKDVMKYLDYFFSAEGKQVMSWGKEGETYTVTNGVKSLKRSDFETFADFRKKTGLYTNGTYGLIDPDARLTLLSTEAQSAYKDARKYDTYLQPAPAFNAKETEVLTTTGQAISKYMQENVTKFILGEKNFDEWDKYVNEVKKLGLDSLLKIYTDAYERQQKAK